jgi:hypothetical protein
MGRAAIAGNGSFVDVVISDLPFGVRSGSTKVHPSLAHALHALSDFDVTDKVHLSCAYARDTTQTDEAARPEAAQPWPATTVFEGVASLRMLYVCG